MNWRKALKVVVEWGPRVVRAVRGIKNEKGAADRGDTLRKRG